MSDLFNLTFEGMAISALTCLALREVFIVALPDNVAGPGGAFIDTDPRK